MDPFSIAAIGSAAPAVASAYSNAIKYIAIGIVALVAIITFAIIVEA